MSSKRQISSSSNNIFWNNLLKERWQLIKNIILDIERINNNKLREKDILLNLKQETIEYSKQEEKIHRLTIMIKYKLEVLNIQFDMIRNISFNLNQSTC